MLEIIEIAESTPGPIEINIATYIWYLQGKVLGSIAATLGVVLPSLTIIFIISLFFDKFIANVYISYAFVGIKCAVSFLIIKAALGMLKKMQKNALNIILFSISFITMILLELFSVNFSSIFLIIIGGIIGLVTNSIIHNKKEVQEWFI